MGAPTNSIAIATHYVITKKRYPQITDTNFRNNGANNRYTKDYNRICNWERVPVCEQMHMGAETERKPGLTLDGKTESWGQEHSWDRQSLLLIYIGSK